VLWVRDVRGVVQHYDWGDPTFIPRLLGVDDGGRPWAELWLGTHRNGAATFADGTQLVDTTGELPYLLKVLAARHPLSLQTHPDAVQARAGFDRGDYPDPNPKPELLCALTRFEAFCGVRPVAATIELLDELGATELSRVLASDGPGGALEGLYRGRLDPQPAIDACRRYGGERLEATWVRSLAQRYPGEASVAVSLLLNLVVLEPGECLRLDAGNLHGYLSGAGIELMGNSDNVIRGGLTVKHVDIDELLTIVDPTPLAEPVLDRSSTYTLPAAGVSLRRLDAGESHDSTGHELGVDLAGSTFYLAPGEQFTATAETFLVVPLAS
jgi:mannose-6-phosphate isomerase